MCWGPAPTVPCTTPSKSVHGAFAGCQAIRPPLDGHSHDRQHGPRDHRSTLYVWWASFSEHKIFLRHSVTVNGRAKPSYMLATRCCFASLTKQHLWVSPLGLAGLPVTKLETCAVASMAVEEVPGNTCCATGTRSYYRLGCLPIGGRGQMLTCITYGPSGVIGKEQNMPGENGPKCLLQQS